jgi:putative copper export protein
MDAVGIAVSVLRGVHVAALVSLFGALLFTAAILPAGEDAAQMRGLLRRLALASALVGLVSGVAWLLMETVAIAGTGTVAATLHAVPTVALRTQFGHWLLARLALLLAVLLLPHRRWIAVPTAVAGVAIAIQPSLGHAGAMGGGAGLQLMASEALHLLACGAWLGGLPPLFFAVGRLPQQDASTVCHNFTPIGLAAVLLLGGTAVVQIGALMGGLPGLFGTSYGHVALVKLGLFAVLLALAAANRLLLTDRLAVATGARRLMLCSIAAEMALGAAVIVTAGFLASLTPGTHEQPVWPFPWRLSFVAFDEPFLRAELVPALSAAVLGVAVFAAGAFWRRIRWPALGIFIVVEALAIPHLDLLFVAAYPTSFFTSPTEFAATAIVSGARVYTAN